MVADFVYLASASPRRRELLTQIGVPFQMLGAAVDETVAPGEAAAAYVLRLAKSKALSGWTLTLESSAEFPPAAVLAADTAVVVGGKILGKPADRTQGERMLLELSGRTHEVLTAVALAGPSGVETRLSRSEVAFRPIAAQEVQDYWETGEAQDKAGGYAVQGRAAIFVMNLRGSYSGVMGLPLYETAELLRPLGLPRWDSSRGR